ncbi:MAG: hypothetical protein KC583_18795 [Myxococcales bacterium]|nr:hypothetical protein [Myxococcales bacterium]
MTRRRWLPWLAGAALVASCTGDRVDWQPTEVCFEIGGGDPPAGWRMAVFWSAGRADGTDEPLLSPVLVDDIEATGDRACVTLDAPSAALQQAARASYDRVSFLWRQPTGDGPDRTQTIATAPVVFVRWVPYLDVDGDGALGGDDAVGIRDLYDDTYGLRVGYVVGYEGLLSRVRPALRPNVWATLASPASPFVRTDGSRATRWDPTLGPAHWSPQDCPHPDQVVACQKVSRRSYFDVQGRWVDPRIDPARVGPSPSLRDLDTDFEPPLTPYLPSLEAYPDALEARRLSRRCATFDDLLIVRQRQDFRLAAPGSCECETGTSEVLVVTLASDPAPGFPCAAADEVDDEDERTRLLAAAGLVMPDDEPLIDK